MLSARVFSSSGIQSQVQDGFFSWDSFCIFHSELVTLHLLSQGSIHQPLLTFRAVLCLPPLLRGRRELHGLDPPQSSFL